MSLEIRDAAEAGRWMSAGVCLLRLAPPGPSEVSAVTRQMLAAVSESGALPPVGVLGDIGKLVAGVAMDFSTPIPPSNPEVIRAVRAYEDQFLGRLAQDPRIEAVCDAIEKLPSSMRDDAVALLAARIVDRIGFESAVAMSPGVARRVVEAPFESVLESGYEVLREAGDVATMIARGYDGLVHRARRTGALLLESDVFVLENLTVLSSLTQRLAIEQVVEVGAELSQALPKQMKPKNSRDSGRTPTNIEDEDRYPIGGFSSISTYGSLENLVTSELIYMDEDPDQVDLFDMRYVEGELLYYTRDESVFVRSRRMVTFIFEPALLRARFKDPGMSYQRLVTVLGLVLTTVQKLAGWLSEEGLFFRVAFVMQKGQSPLHAEMGLMSLLLAEWVDKQMAQVVAVERRDDALAMVVEDAKIAQSDVVDFTMSMVPEEDLDPRVRLALVNVAEPSPAIWWTDHPPAALLSDSEPWSAWVVVARSILQSVIDGA